MVEFARISALDGLSLPDRAGFRVHEIDTPAFLVRIGPLQSRDDLPGPGESCGPWLNIGPREWLCLDKADGVDVSDALVILDLEGGDVAAILAKGIALDFAAFKPGHVTRTRLGEIAVILHRLADDHFRLAISAPYARYFEEWMTHHG